MINNIGSTTSTLSTTINETIDVVDPLGTSSITMISGELTIGAIISDRAGTVATVIGYTVNSQQKYVYELKTITTYTEFDVESLLLARY